MKQHISVAQLNELPNNIRIELNKLWRIDNQVVNLLNHEDINIGTMIEFLSERIHIYGEFDGGLIGRSNIIGETEGKWYVGSCYAEDLCDALWEACKIILE